MEREYRGIKYRYENNQWVFLDYLPAPSRHWKHWSRFLTDKQHKSPQDITEDDIKVVIDRAFSGIPLYTGELNSRFKKKKK